MDLQKITTQRGIAVLPVRMANGLTSFITANVPDEYIISIKKQSDRLVFKFRDGGELILIPANFDRARKLRFLDGFDFVIGMAEDEREFRFVAKQGAEFMLFTDENTGRPKLGKQEVKPRIFPQA
jgi:hypothetical protein